MKKITLTLVGLFTNFISAQAIITETFVDKWENSKVYLLQMAEAMPEEKYGFKPSEREMSFKEQIEHILGNMDWLSGSYFATDKYKKREFTPITTKAQVLAEINTVFDLAKTRIETNSNIDLSQKVDFFAGPKSKLQILNLMQDHVTHHRGQLIVYLNLCQIPPPKYVGW
ncbi:Uncharacterized damage-inducible protein DinB (Forms a four-helix bundle) [Flavobacterium sp. 9R]|uniref:DinB family protein n=1 Tax=Flavobacterium sp. 9R TaxID=2653143 RepID=UPI0012F13642|nr:DinB family protein [Flavobacterium sp. 9R]VXB30744.1 Uncharacterized damage-inducible protein DinB (Forms a four-helix bundle) [Flavobacterium sp. 9R]